MAFMYEYFECNVFVLFCGIVLICYRTLKFCYHVEHGKNTEGLKECYMIRYFRYIFRFQFFTILLKRFAKSSKLIIFNFNC